MLRARPWTSHTPHAVPLADGERAVPVEMTLAEFAAFPWPEGQRWELIGGTPVMTPLPLFSHQDLQYELCRVLHAHLNRAEYRAVQTVDVQLPGTDDYVCPDIAVFGAAPDLTRLPIVNVPALIVEVLSPSTAANDLGAKRESYAEAGVPEYWVANPATGALSVFTAREPGQYVEARADEDGFVVSPLIGKALKIRVLGDRFEILAR